MRSEARVYSDRGMEETGLKNLKTDCQAKIE
jgi:hypothetical protein